MSEIASCYSSLRLCCWSCCCTVFPAVSTLTYCQSSAPALMRPPTDKERAEKGESKFPLWPSLLNPSKMSWSKITFLTGCNFKTRSVMCSSRGEAMFPRATPVGWLSEHCTVLISLPALGVELGPRPHNRCSLVVDTHTQPSAFFSVRQLPFTTFSELYPCSLASLCGTLMWRQGWSSVIWCQR